MAPRLLNLVVSLTYIQTAWSYVIYGGNGTVRRTLALDEFPPKAPVTVQLESLSTKGVTTELRIPVTIGGIDYGLLFDTGSIVTWVMSDRITDEKYGAKKKFPSAKVVPCGEKTLGYGGGQLRVKGPITAQDVEVMEVPRKAFKVVIVEEVLYDRDDDFATIDVDGIFGAEVPLQEDEEKTSQAWLAGTKFAVNYNVGGSSSVTFGDIDFGAAVSVPALRTEDGAWYINSPDLGKIFIDNGSIAMWIPPDFVKKYLSKNNAKGYPPLTGDNNEEVWLVDCDADLSPLKINIGTGSVELSKDALVLPESVFKDEKNRCATTILSSDEDGENDTTFGMPFFGEYIVMFDREGEKIGFQKK